VILLGSTNKAFNVFKYDHLKSIIHFTKYFLYHYLNQWCKLGGANVALTTPYLKCGGPKIYFAPPENY
jgi:hypothetical protein